MVSSVPLGQLTVGNQLELTYKIYSKHVPLDLPPVYYQIKFDSIMWTSESDNSGSVFSKIRFLMIFIGQMILIGPLQISEQEPACVDIRLKAVKHGNTNLPVLRLFYYKNEG